MQNITLISSRGFWQTIHRVQIRRPKDTGCAIPIVAANYHSLEVRTNNQRVPDFIETFMITSATAAILCQPSQ